MRNTSLLLAALVGAGCVTGCAGRAPNVKLTGQLLTNEQPVKVGTRAMSQMVFYSYPDVKENASYSAFPAVLQADGSFEVNQIPTGKYLVSLEIFDMTAGGEVFRGAYKKDNSPIIVDVTAEPLQIDLARLAN
jgi:hypothetical protein